MRKSIKYGYCFWYEDSEFSSIPDEILELGLDFAEVSLTHPWPDNISQEDIQITKNKLKKSRARFAFHSPLEGLFLFNTRDEIVQAALEIHKKSLRFSAEFDPLFYNFHIKAHPMTLRIEGKDIALRKCLQALDELIEFANELEVRLVIENSSSSSYLVPEDELLQRDIGFNLDIGHWFKGGRDAKDLESLVDNVGRRIDLLHLHDALFDNRREDHLSLGDGEIDFTQVFHVLKPAGVKWITLETLPSTSRNRSVPENLSKTKKMVMTYGA